MKDLKTVFSNNLRNKLLEKNRSQADLARFLDISQTSVSHWINGTILPRPKTIDRIAQYLNTTSDWMMTDHTRTVEPAPQDILAEEIVNRPKLFKLMLYAAKLSDGELDELIARAIK